MGYGLAKIVLAVVMLAGCGLSAAPPVEKEVTKAQPPAASRLTDDQINAFAAQARRQAGLSAPLPNPTFRTPPAQNSSNLLRSMRDDQMARRLGELEAERGH